MGGGGGLLTLPPPPKLLYLELFGGWGGAVIWVPPGSHANVTL